MESDRIVSEAIEATEFPHLAQRYAVMGVPRTIVNDHTGIDGALPEQLFLENVLAAAGPKASA
jgi:hypothetical protein